MKVFVTGLSGLIGTRFEHLYGDRHELVNLDRTNGVDITNVNQLREIVATHPDATTIIHLAAFTNVSAAHEQQGDTTGDCYHLNVGGTEVVKMIAAEHNLHLVHASTDYVFDGTKATAYTEEDTPHPIEWYGETKYMAEQVVTTYPKSVILRLAFPYQQHPSRPDFLAKMRQNLQQGTLPPAFTDHVITPTFVDDIAKVFDYCIEHQPSGLYHMVGSSSHTDYEIATLVKETFHLGGEVRQGSLDEYLKKVNRPYQKTMRVSNEKLTRDFGIEMKTLAEGLAEFTD